MGKLRSAIYSHYSEDPERGLFSCLYCGTHVGVGSGTSNMHKHLRIHHPEIDRYVHNGTIVFDHNDYGIVEEDVHQLQLEVEDAGSDELAQEVIQHVPKRKRLSGGHTVLVQSSPVAVVASSSSSSSNNNGPDLNSELSGKFKANKRVGVGENGFVNAPVATEYLCLDIPAKKILKRMKQMTTDHAELTNQMHVNNAELQNELMQLQFDSQEQMRLIKELRRELNELKRSRARGSMNTSGTAEAGEGGGLPKFPLYRMSQVEAVEKRINEDVDFKDRLAAVFRDGQRDKVDSLLRWFSNEVLSQFTYKDDPDSLTTHRCTDLSEIFQLMFSVWSSDAFDGSDFKAVVRTALETANCQMSADNCESNKLKQDMDDEATYEVEAEVETEADTEVVVSTKVV